MVSSYSLLKFRKAIETEQFERLKSNGREIEVIFSDFYGQLQTNRDNFAENPRFTYNLSVGDLVALKEISDEWLFNNVVSSVATFNREGVRLSFAQKDDSNQIKTDLGTSDNILLDAKYRSHLNSHSDLGLVLKKANQLELVLMSKILNNKKRLIGFVEQRIILRDPFLARIKNELKLEFLVLGDEGHPILSTVSSGASLKGLSNSEPGALIDVQESNNIYAFIPYNIFWDKTEIKVFIGTSKRETQRIFKNVNLAFTVVTGLGILFLVVTILISTSVLLKPVSELIDGLRAFENTESLVQVRVKNRTEIGLLIETFNQMSLKVFQTKNELKGKIKELEQANINLKEAQMQLVQSAKMTSLGQLVAGVAHELNNPIGFIYSNTSHLKDYTDKLLAIIEQIEKDPAASAEIKEKYEFDYIKKDLPLLIKSCLDGAQRTRDIVIGLRNFSRIEESQLKEINLNEAIDMTLEFLKGEIKNRISVIRLYGELPPISCYASQINQVLLNILTNAVHAISGSGQIWITTTLVPENKVSVSIKDSGVGMSPEIVEKIFEPFFTTKEVGKGTGLGLSISYGIIQNHEGDIQVNSFVGQGTEFTILIPIQQPKKTSIV